MCVNWNAFFNGGHKQCFFFLHIHHLHHILFLLRFTHVLATNSTSNIFIQMWTWRDPHIINYPTKPRLKFFLSPLSKFRSHHCQQVTPVTHVTWHHYVSARGRSHALIAVFPQHTRERVSQALLLAPTSGGAANTFVFKAAADVGAALSACSQWIWKGGRGRMVMGLKKKQIKKDEVRNRGGKNGWTSSILQMLLLQHLAAPAVPDSCHSPPAAV